MKNSLKLPLSLALTAICVLATLILAGRFGDQPQTQQSIVNPPATAEAFPSPELETNDKNEHLTSRTQRDGAATTARIGIVSSNKQPTSVPPETKNAFAATKPSQPPPPKRGKKERPDQPDEAMRLRMAQSEDENGLIPENALLDAWEHSRRVPVDERVWPVRNINPDMLLSGDEDNDPNVAGIQPSGWAWLGPGNIGGRIRSILIHPTNPQTMWVGSVTGGIWKTTNGGESWAPLNDFMANLSVTTMVMSPTDSNVIYAGTGEGVFRNERFSETIRGAGVFKSTNGGTSWSQLSSTSSSSWHHVGRLAISPTNGQVLLAATSTGIWRTTDGGTTWSNRLSFSMLDINFNPSDGNKCIASGNGFGMWYSTDGGVTWNSTTGLPAGGRIEVAYSRSNPSLVYASVDRGDGELYVSNNGGQSFSLRHNSTPFFNGGVGSQGWYDNIIWVDPTNPNILIVGGIDLWGSANGGVSFVRISNWQIAPQSAHADHHAIVESPQFNGTTNRTVFFGNDGGIYRATDVYNVTQTTGWTALNNNLGITQFYGGAGNPSNGRIIGGTQDNGTLRHNGNPETWNMPQGAEGDGGWSAADPNDPNFLYGEYVFLNIHRSRDGGGTFENIVGRHWNGFSIVWKPVPFLIPDARDSRALFIAPFILDPNNSNRILAGGADLWRTNDAKTANTATTGPSWSSIKPRAGFFTDVFISAIAVAKGNSNIIWVGYDNGDVFLTTNGTSSSPTWTKVDTNSPGLPNRYCTRITIDPTNSQRVYVTFGGFTSGNVWRTNDSGSSWTNITANLPNAPVRSLAVWQQNTNNLYVGTEVGIFASANGGQSWSPTNDGPSNCPVDELFWMNNTLVAATHGRGMFSINVSGSSCNYALSSSTQNFAASGGSGSFTVTTAAGCPWSAVSNASWITTTSSGSGNGAINYTVASNSGAARTGTITVAGQTFTVTQNAQSGGCPSTTLSAGQIVNGSLTTSDCIFTGTTRRVDVYNFNGTAGQQVAISMESFTFDTYLYLINSNNQVIGEDDDGGDGTNSRIPAVSGSFTLPSSGTFTIYATSFLEGSTGSYTLRLTASNCNYFLSPTSQIFIASGSTGSFSVVTGAGCSWNAVSNASWLSTSSSGIGNGTVNFSVAANTGGTRNGTITVAGQTFTIFQSAGNGDGCSSTPIGVGQTISATLNTDCVFTGTSRYVDLFHFNGTAGQRIVIAMNSSAFDTYLFLDGPNNQTIAQNDDGGGGTNSRIPANDGAFTLPATGTYRIYASSFSFDGINGSTGPYSVTLLNQSTGSTMVQLNSPSFSANENSGAATITVTRSGNLSSASTVDYVTSDIAGLQTCTMANTRASERCDYVTSVGTVRFGAGEASKTFSVPLINDSLVEGTETFTISLSNATGALIGSNAAANVSIVDNDSATITLNPIDGVEFFIRQQYLDILNRQPDGTGLQNWINTLGPCPNGGFGEPPTSNCDRLHVAAGFFQSDEFLNRGYWAFRFYMVSFNQRPTYAQFIPDMAQVGGPKSPAEEQASKIAFADAFVQRPQFLARYGGLSGQPLANALLQTAGLPSNTFTVSAGMTNGQILRGIAETSAALNKFLTEGTVSIQYFGFLRRDPDAIGYQNNVDTLNANPNNLRHMIFIFIYSSEYRGRFGPQ